jgi:hypothetical protein
MTPAEVAAVCKFLASEKVQRHTEYEVLCRDRDVLVLQQRRDPMSVRPGQLDTAETLVRRVHEREVYLGELLGAFPADVRDAAVAS